MSQQDLPDVLIIGGSHAGLAAAQTLYRHGHSSIILDSKRPRSWVAWHEPAHTAAPESALHLVPGREGAEWDVVRDEVRRNLQQAARGLMSYEDGAEVVEVRKVVNASNRDRNNKSDDKEESEAEEIFEARDALDRKWQGRKLLLATGVKDNLPDIPGYKEAYPKRIFHCLFTFGIEALGATLAGLLARDTLASPMHAIMLAVDTLKFARRLVFLTDGQPDLEPQFRKIALKVQPDISPLIEFDHRSICSFAVDNDAPVDRGIDVNFEGDTRLFNFVVHQPKTSAAPATLLAQLGLTTNERGDIETTGPFGATTVSGVYVAGDCTSLFKIVPAAQFSGAAAGAGLARALGVKQVRKRAGLV